MRERKNKKLKPIYRKDYSVVMNQIKETKFWQAFHEKTSHKQIPFKASLELTYRCNLRCWHCYNPKQGTSEELSYPEVCSILDQLSKMGCFHINLTGGDPLVRPDLLKILTHAKKKGFYTILLTNATLFTPHISDHLKSINIDKVDISLYGMTERTYKSVTGVSGSFTRCLRGIELLRERDISFSLKMPVTTLNKNEFAQAKAFANNLGVRFRWSYLIHPVVDGSEKPLVYRISAGEAVALEKRVQPHLFEGRERFQKSGNVPDRKDSLFYCNAGKNSLAITPNGKMNLCLEYHFPEYDLRKGSVAGGWKELTSYVKSAKPDSSYQCGDCELQSFCKWCPAVGWLEEGDNNACTHYYKELASVRKEKMEIG